MEALDEDVDAEPPFDNDDSQKFSGRPRGLSVASASGGPQRKISTAVDIETGKLGGHREHVAEIRRQSDCGPRRRHIFHNLFPGSENTSDSPPKRKWRNGNDIDDGLSLSIHGRLEVHTSSFREKGKLEAGTQYRLSAQKTQQGAMTGALKMLGISAGQAGIYEDAGGASDEGCRCFGISPNNMVTMYLHWTFRNSFMVVFFSAAVAFYGLTLVFALLIWAAGTLQPSCIFVNGQFFGGDADFANAYALSWQTFSTTGYGLIYPSTSSMDGFNAHRCAGVAMVCSLESFVGILFGSFCGAIVFGKVARVRSHAQVEFSDPIVVRYGTGVLMEGADDASSTTTGKDNDGTKLTEPMHRSRFPCPILEFRIVNRLHSTLGGEIMDGTIHVVASIDELQASPSGPSSSKGRRRKGKRRGTRHTKHKFGAKRSAIPESEPSTSSLGGLLNLSGHTHQAFDEDPGGEVLPRRVFSKLELETPDHPFFKRVWLARHILDDQSPLVTPETRLQIRMNDGFWPESLNDFEAVRASIRFDQILVSLSGTSNADANSVYAQKVYEYVDMNVGYRFANMLYRDVNDGSLRVDASIINDVVEQHGGGAEPLTVVDKGMREILVL